MLTERPRYREAVAVGWSILWRTVGSFLALLFVANLALFALLPELTRTEPSWAALVLPLVVVTALSAGLIMPFVVRRVIRLSFHGCRLVLVRDGRVPSAVPPSAPFDSQRRSHHERDVRSGTDRPGGDAQSLGDRGRASRAG